MHATLTASFIDLSSERTRSRNQPQAEEREPTNWHHQIAICDTHSQPLMNVPSLVAEDLISTTPNMELMCHSVVDLTAVMVVIRDGQLELTGAKAVIDQERDVS